MAFHIVENTTLVMHDAYNGQGPTNRPAIVLNFLASNNYYPHLPIGMLGIYRLLFLSFSPSFFLSFFLSLSAIFCNGSPPWVDAGRWNFAGWYRAGWAAGRLLFWWTLAHGLAPKAIMHWTVSSQLWQTGRWRRCVWLANLATTSHSLGGSAWHVGICASRDNWRTC